MTELPTTYVRVARQLTGYWGTYLPSIPLAPGDVGRNRRGVFVREGRLANFAGFDPVRHGTEEQEAGSPGTVWKSDDVETGSLGGDLSLPAAAGGGSIQLKFGSANEAAILCKNARSWSFSDLLAVKELMRALRLSKVWDDTELCLVTEVMRVDWGWIGFSTDANQVAEIKLNAKVPAVPIPGLEALEAVAASGSISASWQKEHSAGWHSEVQSGGTPLFRAIQFVPGWPFGLGAEKLDYAKGVVGGNAVFEEPEFG